MEHWVYTISGISFDLDTIITMWLCMSVIIICSFFMTRNVSIVPSKGQAFAEKAINVLLDLTDSMMGKGKGAEHVPILASLFIFILIANLCGQLPWKLIHLSEGEFASPTNDINVTASMAIIVLLYYVIQGVRTKGIKYFLEGFDVQSIIVALIDILEMAIRPFSLALRLYANILAGEILISAVVGICAIGVPMLANLFEVLVAFIQAAVFTLLTMSYISLSIKKEEE